MPFVLRRLADRLNMSGELGGFWEAGHCLHHEKLLKLCSMHVLSALDSCTESPDCLGSEQACTQFIYTQPTIAKAEQYYHQVQDE